MKNIFTIFKIFIIITIIYYLYININYIFIENFIENIHIVLIIFVISLIKILINTIKISYLLRIIGKTKNNINKIFEILFVSEISVALPASTIASKTWIDLNLVKNFNLNFKDYIKFNFLTGFFSILIFALVYINYRYSNFQLITLASIIIIILSSFIIKFQKFKNYVFYFTFFAINLLANILISYIVIYYLRPEILENNIFNIFASSLISIYLNLISILPLNFGYSQMVYGISFKYFSLPGELAFAIATIRQIAQVFVILLALLIFTKKSKLNTNNQK